MLLEAWPMQQWAAKFYKSRAWVKLRDAVLATRCGLCERCGRPGLIIHHKVRLTPENIGDPMVALAWDNLEVVCLDCHNRAHGGGSTAEGLVFDAAGNLVPK